MTRDMIANSVDEVTAMDGEELCIEGEDQGLLYIIIDGECEIIKDWARVMQFGLSGLGRLGRFSERPWT